MTDNSNNSNNNDNIVPEITGCNNIVNINNINSVPNNNNNNNNISLYDLSSISGIFSYLNALSLQGRIAIRANIIPGIILQLIAISIVICYYLSSSVQSGFDNLAIIKHNWGYLFSGLSSIIAGGIIPTIIIGLKEKYSNNIIHRTIPLYYEGLFYCCEWCYKGIEVDAFYRLQALWFGSASTTVVIIKVLIDQFIYNPLFASHTTAIPYLFKDCNFNIKLFKIRIKTKQFWLFTWPCVLINTWSVWFIACAIIYCLPNSLQIPLFCIMLAFWSTVLAVITNNNANTNTDTTNNNNNIINNSSISTNDNNQLSNNQLLDDNNDKFDSNNNNNDSIELNSITMDININQTNLAIKSNIKLKQVNEIDHINNNHSNGITIQS